jgi:hypothetical protein
MVEEVSTALRIVLQMPLGGTPIANLPVDNDRPRLIDVLTQLLPFVRYP